MKILITSGGTKIPIDSVRSITNMSKGTFGAKITTQLHKIMWQGGEIIFLMAKGSAKPQMATESLDGLNRPLKITFWEYDTFWDYAGKLETICKMARPDAIVLAAAVSDYEVENPVDGKIRTSDELVIRLKPLPKLISKVREWLPDAFICGFKLLVGSDELELVQNGVKSLYQNDLDMVVCNDLRDIKEANHKLKLIMTTPTGFTMTRYEASYDPDNPLYLATMVANSVFTGCEEKMPSPTPDCPLWDEPITGYVRGGRDKNQRGTRTEDIDDDV